MSKLLRANFARLFRSLVFWLGIAFMVFYGLFICNDKQIAKDLTDTSELLFSCFNTVCFVYAVFCCMFTGTEYSDGTIRNKLIVGHSRTAVYFTNYVTNAAAGILMVLAYMTAVLAMGIPIYGFYEWPEIASMLLLDGILLVLSATAVFTLLAMLIQNKAICVSVCLLATVGIFFLGTYLSFSLLQPEYAEVFTVEGVSKTIKNPSYVPESLRGIYLLALNILPPAQGTEITVLSFRGFQSTELSPASPQLMAIYSGVLTAVSNLAGIFFFRRKDLK